MLRRVDSVKIKLTFSIYVKKFNASLKTLILFRLSTKSRTESKPYSMLVIFSIKWIEVLFTSFFSFGAVRFVIRKAKFDDHHRCLFCKDHASNLRLKACLLSYNLYVQFCSK